jgi:glycosyltransferase involved in cell wall biosynthesis
MASREKKLLFLDLGGSMGGVESYLISLSGMLRDSAAVYAICVLPELAARFKNNGVNVYLLPRFGGAAKPLRFLVAFFVIVYVILRHRIDVLQANGFLESVFILPARLLGREALYTRHGPFEDDLYIWYKDPLRYAPRLLSKLCVRFASHVICVSESVGDVVKQVIPAERTTVIPNWVAQIPPYYDRFLRDNGGLRVLYVGRLEKYKGLQLLIEALRGVPDVRLTVLGDGGYRKELESLAAGMNVEFAGFQRDTEQYYADADVFVMPSLGPEGLPMVTIEAMAHGLPCLFSDLLVHREITGEGKAGLLFRSGDVDDLREKLLALLKDATLRRSLSLQAYGMVKQKYNPEIARQSYLCAFGL